jgi:ketosteroid isomerase-like protein
MADARRALLEEIYADWTRGDYSRTDLLHPEFELVFARDFLDEGAFRGTDDAAVGWQGWLSQWSLWRTTPLEYLEQTGDLVAVRIEVEGVSKSTGMKLKQESGNLWTFRDGMPFRLTIYARVDTLLEDLAARSS